MFMVEVTDEMNGPVVCRIYRGRNKKGIPTWFCLAPSTDLPFQDIHRIDLTSRLLLVLYASS